MIGLSGKNLLHGASFNHLAAINHSHILTKLCDNTQIVGNKDHGGSQLLLQILHQGQNLSLNGHIQCSGGLVSQQQIGLGHQRHGNHHPLLHAAGELVGELLAALRRNAHQCQKLCHPLVPLLLGHIRIMDFQDLTDLISHRHHRVQAGHGILENHGDFRAPQATQLPLGHLQYVLAVIRDAAAGNLCHMVRQQLHNV